MRTFDTVFGVGLLVLVVLFSVFGDPLAEPSLAAPVLAFGLAGALFLLGGLVDELPLGRRRIRWYVFSGIAMALVGLTFSSSLFSNPQFDGTVGRAFVRFVAVANALIFGYMGFDTARGGGRAAQWTPQGSGG